ncbi:MAG: ATP-binding protein [Syntrophales bacterium]|nr:ATP-binding protein [Syntrophales bacterium]
MQFLIQRGLWLADKAEYPKLITMPFADYKTRTGSFLGQSDKRPDRGGRDPRRYVMVAGCTPATHQFAATLSAGGLQVRRARNWTQVMDQLDDESLALLLLDPRLKGMGLLEGLRLIRKMNPSLIPLVLGPLTQESQTEVLRLGAGGVLPADLPAPILVDWVRSYEQRQRLRRENERFRSRILESEAYLASILDHLDEGIITTDAAGRVLAANQVARNLCQLPPGSLAAHPLEGINFTGDGLHTLAETVARVLETGFYEGRFLLSREGRSPFPVFFRGSVHRLPGGELETILVFRDLTAQEELELRAEESERLVALGQIAAGMAHEIRNPLMAVGGMVRRLERLLSPEDPGQMYLPAIRDNVQRMEDMVRDIDEYLQYVRVSSHHFLDLTLEHVLNAALARLEGAADLSALTLEAGPFDDLRIQGDAASLTEMFFQICRNSVEAMSQGGTLKVQIFPEGGLAVVQIADNGRGIPLEDFSHIYHPFFTTKMTGAGMGLTKVFMIAQRHRGQIEVDSRPQQGTIFTVRLPLSSSQ